MSSGHSFNTRLVQNLHGDSSGVRGRRLAVTPRPATLAAGVLSVGGGAARSALRAVGTVAPAGLDIDAHAGAGGRDGPRLAAACATPGADFNGIFAGLGRDYDLRRLGRDGRRRSAPGSRTSGRPMSSRGRGSPAIRRGGRGCARPPTCGADPGRPGGQHLPARGGAARGGGAAGAGGGLSVPRHRRRCSTTWRRGGSTRR